MVTVASSNPKPCAGGVQSCRPSQQLVSVRPKISQARAPLPGLRSTIIKDFVAASVFDASTNRARRRHPMKILITAPKNENHTAPLKWALEQAGYTVACWTGLGWTEDKQASISLLPNLQIKDTQIKLGRHLVEPGDVIWIRRPVDPKPNPQTAPEDAKFAANEYRSFNHSLMYLLETLPVRVVNKYTASRFINNKSVQLLLARACGMNVPRTLMTNSPQAVREYFRGNPELMI